MTNIAIFHATSGHSGVDRAAANLVPELVKRGYCVDLLKVQRHGPNIDLDDARFRCIDLGVSHVYPAVPALVRYLRRERPTVLLADKDRVNRTALLARRLAGARATRLVLSSGTTISIDLQHRGRFERALQRWSMGRLYRHADQVIVTSDGVADDMSAYTGLERARIRTVPSPVIPDALLTEDLAAPEHPWFDEPGPPVVVAVGALRRRKGFDTLLRAFAALRRLREARLVIVGEGPERGSLEALAAELGIADHVHLVGFVAQPYAWMAHADVFAMTSRWEGLGFVLIEALAVGTTAVATDCPSGPREILHGGRYGALVPVDDERAFAEALNRAIDRPQRRERLAEAAAPYTVSAATDAYLDAFGLPHQAGESR